MTLAARPPLVTAVGIIGLVAGIFPVLEVGAVLLSPRLSAWLIPLVRSIVPVRRSIALGLLLGIGAIDVVLGIGVLARKRWATPGMILRSVATVPIDYANFRVGNQAGALFGLAVSVFIVWALLRPQSRAWFGQS
jgi:Predicted membrane protein (DUF2127)